VFTQAGIDRARGFNDLLSRDQFVEALGSLVVLVPGIRKAVIKLTESFAGAGNAPRSIE
jgi:hypothetical protein